MRLIIAGTRTLGSYNPTDRDYMAMTSGITLIEKACSERVTEVVSGVSGGVDLMGVQWAETLRVPVRRFPPDWKTKGRAAGPLRNEDMAEYADALLLLWDEQSRGSADMKKRALQHRLTIVEGVLWGRGMWRFTTHDGFRSPRMGNPQHNPGTEP